MNIVCEICGSEEIRPFYEKNGFSTVRCGACGVVFVYPAPKAEDVRKIYEDDQYFSSHYSEIDIWEKRSGDFRQKPLMTLSALARISSIDRKTECGPGRVRFLEIGSSYGVLLEVAKWYGWQVFGIETNRRLAELSKARGLNVIGGDFEDALPSLPHDFDVVALYHVIEHLTDPTRAIRQIYDILVPGGMVVIQTPNVESRAFQIQKTQWEYFKPPEHLFYFSLNSIRHVLETAGFELMTFEGGGLMSMVNQIARIPFLKLFQTKALFSMAMLDNVRAIPAIAKKFVSKSANFDESITVFAEKVRSK